MTRIAYASVTIQPSSCASPATPPWFGEVVLLVSHLQKQGVFDAINTQVRFARRRFGHYEVLDFVAVLFGHAVSGERTLQAFYERLRPWATAFMALFGRDRLPSRSALSRWLARLRRKRGEIVRTRTTVLQAHTHHWRGTWGNPGHGDYRGELRQAVAAIGASLKRHQVPPACAVVRLDGPYGTGAVLVDLAGPAYVTRGQDDHLLDRDEVQARLPLPPDQQSTHEDERRGSRPL